MGDTQQASEALVTDVRLVNLTAPETVLDATMRQEFALRLGIQLDQQSATWRAQVYPGHYSGDCPTVAGLDLGRGSVLTERR